MNQPTSKPTNQPVTIPPHNSLSKDDQNRGFIKSVVSYDLKYEEISEQFSDWERKIFVQYDGTKFKKSFRFKDKVASLLKHAPLDTRKSEPQNPKVFDRVHSIGYKFFHQDRIRGVNQSNERLKNKTNESSISRKSVRNTLESDQRIKGRIKKGQKLSRNLRCPQRIQPTALQNIFLKKMGRNHANMMNIAKMKIVGKAHLVNKVDIRKQYHRNINQLLTFESEINNSNLLGCHSKVDQAELIVSQDQGSVSNRFNPQPTSNEFTVSGQFNPEVTVSNPSDEQLTASNLPDPGLTVSNLTNPELADSNDLNSELQAPHVTLKIMSLENPKLPAASNKNKPKTFNPRSYKETKVRQNKLRKQFVPPFETYYYRDFLWKVNYSNEQLIHTPLEYEHRLRVFIGRGNNSGLIRGLIKRRLWFAITDRIGEANFVWTQLKVLSYYDMQPQLKKKQEVKENSAVCQEYEELGGLLTKKERDKFQKYLGFHANIEEREDERLKTRGRFFIVPEFDPPRQGSPGISTIVSNVPQIRQQRLQNHFPNNYIIGNKKTLFKTMNLYYKSQGDCVFNYLPYTFHIERGKEDCQYSRFVRFYQQREREVSRGLRDAQQNSCNHWIVKPGEYSNRGNGISICHNLSEINTLISHKDINADKTQRTYILQTYIDQPLLYNKRKFDLRHYMMITSVNGIVKGYWYRQGYVRTSSSEYSLNTKQTKIHLTNDAVQKNLSDYGRYEKGNKISYDELHHYISRLYGYKNYDFKNIIIPKMKKITTDVIKACSGSIDPEARASNFEIFGLDFMIDAQFNLWLIQVNTNPCLEISCPLLSSIIPNLIENALQITLDPLFPPPVRYTPKGTRYFKKIEEQNQFDLVYDSRVDGFYRESEKAIDDRLLVEEDQTYEDDGSEWSDED